METALHAHITAHLSLRKLYDSLHKSGLQGSAQKPLQVGLGFNWLEPRTGARGLVTTLVTTQMALKINT
jgi:hypothetical protein